MSSGQRITGDYKLETESHDLSDTNIDFLATNVNISRNLHVGGNTIIAGDLTVQGITTTVSSVQLTVTDPIITLANGVLQHNPIAKAGIEVDRGYTTTPGDRYIPQFYWDEPTESWMLFDGVKNYFVVVNEFTQSASGLQAVVDDPIPALGGNLDVNTQAIYSTTGNIQVNNTVTLPRETFPVTVTPPAPSGEINVTLYNKGAHNADSGLAYITSIGATGDLISKKKALVFSLIF
jgi:hypothetical protein